MILFEVDDLNLRFLIWVVTPNSLYRQYVYNLFYQISCGFYHSTRIYPWDLRVFFSGVLKRGSRRSASRTDIRIVQNQFAWRSVCSFEVSFHKNLSSPAWCCSKLIALLDLLPDHQPNTAPLFAESTRRCRTFLGNASCMLLIGFELACAWYLFVTCMNRPLYWKQTISLHADFKERRWT